MKYDQKYLDIIIAPEHNHLAKLLPILENGVKISAQDIGVGGGYQMDMYENPRKGSELNKMKIEWTIIGHSDRRLFFHESNQSVAIKIKRAFNFGLNVIICIGET